MKTRIMTGAVGICLLAGALRLFYTPVFPIVLITLLLIATFELARAFGLPHPAGITAGMALPIALTMLAQYLDGLDTVAVSLFYTAVFIALLLVLRFPRYGFVQLAGVVCFGAIALSGFYAMVYMGRLYTLTNYPWLAVTYVLLALGAAWGGDTFAYFTGTFFGKHKMAPTLSPHKTVEGFFGGIVGSVLTDLFILWFHGTLSGVKISGGGYAFLALAAAVASLLGVLGDLMASAIKRQCGVKDFGNILPGHGGILDRFDSVFIVMPFFALLLRHWPTLFF